MDSNRDEIFIEAPRVKTDQRIFHHADRQLSIASIFGLMSISGLMASLIHWMLRSSTHSSSFTASVFALLTTLGALVGAIMAFWLTRTISSVITGGFAGAIVALLAAALGLMHPTTGRFMMSSIFLMGSVTIMVCLILARQHQPKDL